MQIFIQKLNKFRTFFVFQEGRSEYILIPYERDGDFVFLYEETIEDNIQGYLIYGEAKRLPTHRLSRLAVIKKIKLTQRVSFIKIDKNESLSQLV